MLRGRNKNRDVDMKRKVDFLRGSISKSRAEFATAARTNDKNVMSPCGRKREEAVSIGNMYDIWSHVAAVICFAERSAIRKGGRSGRLSIDRKMSQALTSIFLGGR